MSNICFNIGQHHKGDDAEPYCVAQYRLRKMKECQTEWGRDQARGAGEAMTRRNK
jgi:hypothetical protein